MTRGLVPSRYLTAQPFIAQRNSSRGCFIQSCSRDIHENTVDLTVDAPLRRFGHCVNIVILYLTHLYCTSIIIVA